VSALDSVRCWELRATGERPLTINAVAAMHRMKWARRTSATRALWWGLALEAHIPRLLRARIVVTPLHADGSSPQDVAACAPEAKAAVDGLVDARVLPDDGPAHLEAITFLPALVEGVDGLQLRIEDAFDFPPVRLARAAAASGSRS
jgi:hypothetical protein